MATSVGDCAVPVRRRALLLGAAAAFSVAVAILVVGAEPSATERRLGGVWRIREVLGAGAALWFGAMLTCGAVSRACLFRAVALSVVSAAALALLEGLGVAGLLDYARIFRNVPGEALGSRAIPNADIEGVTWPDTAAAWGLPADPIPFRYRTDRRGYRNERDREAADVYLLGDSYLVAALVPFEETVCGRLEAELGRPVANIALIGVGVQRELEMLREASVPLQGRLLLQFVYEGNDLADSAAYRSRAGVSAARTSVLHRSFLQNAFLGLQRVLQPVHPVAARRSGWIGDERYTFFWTRKSFAGLEAEIEPVLATLGETAREVAAAGGTYAVVVIPEKLRVLGPRCRWPEDSDLRDVASHCGPLPQAVLDWCERSGVPSLDLRAPLEASADAGQIPWFPTDTHWNPAGHRVAARAVGDWVRARGWLPAR